MNEWHYKYLTQQFARIRNIRIFQGSISLDHAVDVICSLLSEEDSSILRSAIKQVRSSAVREYLAKMKKIEEDRKEKERQIMEELTESPAPKLPGKLIHYSDRDPDLPTHVVTAADYRK